MTLVVLASRDDPTVGDARLANGALASTIIVLILSITPPPAQDRKAGPAGLTLKLPEHVLTILDGWAASDAQATPRKFLTLADTLCTNEEPRTFCAEPLNA